MSRRVVFFFAALAVLIAFAVAPWTISSPRLKDQIRRQLRDGYGLELAASGQTTIALLPMPRLKFANATLTGQDGAPIVAGTLLRGEVRLWPLIAARLELTDLSLTGGAMTLEIRPDGTSSWDTLLARLQDRALAADSSAHLRRLVLNRTRIAVDDQRSGQRTELSEVALVARWPSPGSAIGVSASALWRGEAVKASLSDILPNLLAAGKPSPAALHIATRHGEANLTGELVLVGEPRLNGQITARTPALDAFLDWSGLAQTLPGSRLPLEITGEIALSRNEIALPRDRFILGTGRLDGAATIRLEKERRSVRATLAGDALDFTDLAAFGRTEWRAAPVDLVALRRADLDLRLSASSIAIGGVTLGDVAASLLTSADRVEVSLGRATLADGVIRGRLSLGAKPAEYDVKLQTTFSRVDSGSLLVSLGLSRMLTGTAQGQAQFEATGDNPAEILRSLTGRFGVTIQDGEMAGLALAEGLRRTEERPAATSVAARRGGRTPFQQVAINLNVANGVAEFSECTLDSAFVHAAMTGQISLVDRRAALTARMAPPVEGGTDLPNYVLDVSGPWDRLNIARVSGAAMPAR